MDHAHHHHHHEEVMTAQAPVPTQHMGHHMHHDHQHIAHPGEPMGPMPKGSMGSMPMSSMPMGSMSMSSMSMGFHLHTSAHFLFEGLHINTVEGIAIAVLVTILASVVYEGCNSYVVSHRAVKFKRLSRQRRLVHHLLLTLLKTFTICLGYIVMLAVMTYNVWILISVILGSGISHHIIRPAIYDHLRKHEEKHEIVLSEDEVLHDFLPEETGKLLDGNERLHDGIGKLHDEKGTLLNGN